MFKLTKRGDRNPCIRRKTVLAVRALLWSSGASVGEVWRDEVSFPPPPTWNRGGGVKCGIIDLNPHRVFIYRCIKHTYRYVQRVCRIQYTSTTALRSSHVFIHGYTERYEHIKLQTRRKLHTFPLFQCEIAKKFLYSSVKCLSCCIYAN